MKFSNLSTAAVLLFLFLLCSSGCRAAGSSTQTAPVDGYKVVATFPHSTQNYTEGFFYRNGLFYEGTGLQGRSELLVEQPETGRVLQRLALPAQYFGEGIVDWGSNLYEWTWESHTGFVYDQFSLRLLRRFTYSGEGWGMTRSAHEIITSDGSDTLRFRNPETFAETRHIVVHDGSTRIKELNELEFIQRPHTAPEIYANVWHTDRIARCSPRDGHVIAWIDLTGILPDSEKIDGESVLNGIAYDAQHDRIFVTGKQWPKIFQIEIVPGKKSRAGR